MRLLQTWRSVAYASVLLFVSINSVASAYSHNADDQSSSPSSSSSTPTAQPLQVRLGYPANAKLLILNADDLAVTHSEDVASFAALDQKLITSATVMVPCPWFTEVANYAKVHPDADLGLHLTLTSEWRWSIIPSGARRGGNANSTRCPAPNFARHSLITTSF